MSRKSQDAVTDSKAKISPAPGVDEGWHYKHDVMNLIVLPFVCAANLYYMYGSRTEFYYWLNFWVFILYLLLDTLWVYFIPRSVASPDTILIHHVFTMVGWSLPPIFGMHLCYWCSAGLLVEVNTWLLIARRNFRSVAVLGPLFYVTWVLSRLVYYPITGTRFILTYIHDYEQSKSIDVGGTIYIVLWLGLNYLNFSWSYNLIFKEKKKEPSKGL